VHRDPGNDPLLRALAEFRELDQQVRKLPVESEPYRRSVERLQAKSREVFQLGGREDDEADWHEAVPEDGW
jgi:hypothetical protein